LGPEGFELNYYSILYTPIRKKKKKFRIKPEIENSVENKFRPSTKLDPELLETAMANFALIQIKKARAI